MSKAVRDAMLSFMSAMEEAQAIAMKEAQAAGIAHTKATNDKTYRGRKPSCTEEQVHQIMEMFDSGTGVNQITRDIGLNKFAVSRITRNPTEALAKLYKWKEEIMKRILEALSVVLSANAASATKSLYWIT